MYASDRRQFLRTLGAGAAASLIPLTTRASEVSENNAGQLPNPYREDLEYLFTTLMEVHPRPDWHVSMARLETAMIFARLQTDSCETVADFWSIAQRFLHVMYDGHTHVEAPGAEYSYMPLSVTEAGGNVVVNEVIDPAADHGVARGDVILAIDGTDVERVIDDALQTACYTNIHWGRRRILRDSLLRTPTGERSSAALTVGRSSGAVETVVVPFHPFDTPVLTEYRREEQRQILTSCVDFEFDETSKAGILHYRASTDRNDPYGRIDETCAEVGLTVSDVPIFEDVCGEFFGILADRDWHRIVIDIRGNEGGNADIAKALYKYLTRQKLRSYGADPHTSQRIEYPYGKPPQNGRLEDFPQFDGEIAVLIDNGTFSAGEWLAVILRGNNIGTFIGEPTTCGGSGAGNNARYTLPNTGLYLRVPGMFFYAPLPPEHTYPGVLPDFHVGQTLDDFRSGRDTVIEFVRARWS
jgi:hypothetical protein